MSVSLSRASRSGFKVTSFLNEQEFVDGRSVGQQLVDRRESLLHGLRRALATSFRLVRTQRFEIGGQTARPSPRPNSSAALCSSDIDLGPRLAMNATLHAQTPQLKHPQWSRTTFLAACSEMMRLGVWTLMLITSTPHADRTGLWAGQGRQPSLTSRDIGQPCRRLRCRGPACRRPNRSPPTRSWCGGPLRRP